MELSKCSLKVPLPFLCLLGSPSPLEACCDSCARCTVPPGSEVIRSVVQSVMNLHLRRTEVVSQSACLRIAQRRGRAPDSLKCKSHMTDEEHLDRRGISGVL